MAVDRINKNSGVEDPFEIAKACTPQKVERVRPVCSECW
jgi:hypothetical protein